MAGLLAIYPLLHAAPAAEPAAPSRLDYSTARSPSSYLGRRDDVYDKAGPDSILEEYSSWTGVTDGTESSKRSEDIDVDTTALAKRLEALDLVEVSGRTNVVKRSNPVMRSAAIWGDTWFGSILFENEEEWTADTIKDFAARGYRDIIAKGGDTTTVVSALWIPGKGCYLGSIPKGPGVELFAQRVENEAPRLYHHIRNRVVDYVDYAKYHAEDMACYESERLIAKGTYENEGVPKYQYPAGSLIYSHGFTPKMSSEGPMPPCFPGKSKIRPSCQTVMHKLMPGSM